MRHAPRAVLAPTPPPRPGVACAKQARFIALRYRAAYGKRSYGIISPRLGGIRRVWRGGVPDGYRQASGAPVGAPPLHVRPGLPSAHM